MGRPRKDPVVRPHPRPVRLDADVDDALCRLSIRHDVSVHALLKLAARMLVEVEPAKLDQVVVRRIS